MIILHPQRRDLTGCNSDRITNVEFIIVLRAGTKSSILLIKQGVVLFFIELASYYTPKVKD